MSLYTDLVTAGVPLDHHESDLYALVCPAATRILNATGRYRVTRFRSTVDGMMWYDVPFAYAPFWLRDKKGGTA